MTQTQAQYNTAIDNETTINILALLDRPIAFHRIFVKLTGSVKGALLLSQAIYWQQRTTLPDEWFYKTAEAWQSETGLTRHELDQARKDCLEFLETDLRGVPATTHWRVRENNLYKALLQFAGKRQTSLPESGKQDRRKAANIKRNHRLPQRLLNNGARAPKANTIPELVLIRELTGYYPARGSFGSVTEAIQKMERRLRRAVTVQDLQSWFERWCNMGNKPTNLAWLIDHAAPGVPFGKPATRYGNKSNGKNQTSEQPLTQDELEAARADFANQNR